MAADSDQVDMLIGLRGQVWTRGCCTWLHPCLMKDAQKFQRVCRVSPARLRMVQGINSPTILRRMADELEWLAEDEIGCGWTGEL